MIEKAKLWIIGRIKRVRIARYFVAERDKLIY